MELLRLSACIVAAVWCLYGQTYSVVIAGRIAGKEVHTTEAGGSIRIAYSYNDRGRGPQIDGRYRFGDDGIPAAIELTGHDYLKAPVDERFTLAAGHSQWKSAAESGQSASRGWYAAAAAPPGERAWLARAILRSGRKSLALLPSGEAVLDGGATHVTLHQGAGSAALTLYSISGLGFSPATVWLDGHNDLFAADNVIRQGWESHAPELRAAEARVAGERDRALAARLGHRPSQGFAILHVRVFDSDAAGLREGQTVLVKGDRIAAVGADAMVPLPAGVETIDGTGDTLLPGLFDMHVHFAPFEGLLNIAAGVTSVRDLGNDMDELLALKGRMDASERIGPRVFLAGVIDGRGPYTAPTNVLADTEDEARHAIDTYAAHGYFQIKIYSSVKPSLVPFIARTAHAKGMRVSGHVPAGMIARQFVDAGVDEIQHINFLFLNFWPAEAATTNTPARLTFPASHAAKLDLDSPQVTAFLEKLKQRHIVVDPTLGAFEEYVARVGVPSPSYAEILDWLPAQVRRTALQGGLPVPEGSDRLYRDSFQAFLNMTAKLYRAGIPLVIGTDGIEGLMLHRELELWVKAGIPPERVLQIATLGAARVARADARLGSIAPGKLADLVLVEGNPAHTIGDIRKTRVTVKDGVVYRCADVYRAAGVRER